MEKKKSNKKRSESRGRRTPQPSKPELEEFFESVHERMKSLAIAQKTYRARNDKELSVQPGEFFEVLDDVGSWWCLRAPSGRTGHVPKTHLEIIPNPIKEAEHFNDQPVDPIVVKVPVIVKASVQHQEVEETVKPATSRRPGTPPPSTTPPTIPLPPSKKVESADSKVEEEKTVPVPPPQPIFPPPINSQERPPYHTVVKEVIREIPPSRHYRRNRSKHQHKRDISPQYSERSSTSCSSKTSSSSGVASWISGTGYERMVQRQRDPSHSRRMKSHQQRSPRRSVGQPSKPSVPPAPSHQSGHARRGGGKEPACRYRSVCCYSSPRSRARSTITDMSHRESSKKEESHQPQQSQQQQSQQQQQQQPMIILLEAPKQEAPQVPEEHAVDDYYDPNNQPQISIVLPPNAQLTPQVSAYTPLQQLPQYGQVPAYYNWPTQFYQGYA